MGERQVLNKQKKKKEKGRKRRSGTNAKNTGLKEKKGEGEA